MKLPEPRLLVVTDRIQARRTLRDVVHASLDGGCRWIWFRERDLDQTERARLLRPIRLLTAEYGATLCIGGRPDFALAEGADGIQLPAGADVKAARARAGTTCLLGYSAHGASEACQAVTDGADYVTFSPVFPSLSKPGYAPNGGVEALRALAERLPQRVMALGGIENLDRLRSCMTAGAVGTAVMGVVMRAEDPASIVQGFVGALSADGPA